MERGKKVEKESTGRRKEKMRIGIAADHGGFELKELVKAALDSAGYEVKDFGAHKLVTRR